MKIKIKVLTGGADSAACRGALDAVCACSHARAPAGTLLAGVSASPGADMPALVEQFKAALGDCGALALSMEWPSVVEDSAKNRSVSQTDYLAVRDPSTGEWIVMRGADFSDTILEFDWPERR
jgi:hypothetical protein